MALPETDRQDQGGQGMGSDLSAEEVLTIEDVDAMDIGDICFLLQEYGSWWEWMEGSEVPWAETLASVGGSEGSGEYMAVIIKVGSRIFRKEGCYVSWDGSSWDGKFREVKPVEKVVTVWQEKES